jgi:2-deoxy-D-gluconate 3-dehydrogenase
MSGTFASFSLSGRRAVVTGGSRGLGAAISVALAEAGADILLVARSDCSQTESAVRATGRRAESLAIDLGERGSEKAVVEAAQRAFGGADILINNAGMIRRETALEFSESDWDDVISVNLTSCFRLAQAFARTWVAEGRGGKIVNIASMLSFQGGIRVVSYTAAKSGLLGVTRALANELAPHGINVNAVAPGYMATDNTAALRADETRNREIVARIPAGRWGAPADLGGAVVFLSSEASSYIHGTVLAVDGGWLSR